MIAIRSMAVACAFPLLIGCWAVLAQDKPRKADDDLEKLLERLESKSVGGSARDERKPQTEPPPAESSRSQGKSEPSKSQPTQTKPARPVAPKDKELDDLLEKLGQTEEAPTTTGRPSPGPGTKPKTEPAKTGDRPQDPLPEESQRLDQRLEEILGRKKRPPEDQQGEGGGMLAEAIKRMREVEQRLEQPDTGEETRQKQEEIVKNLDSILEQLRKQSQSSTRKMRTVQKGQQTKQQGQQPGAQPGTEAGQAPRGAEKPTTESVLANDKNPWGHLPDSLREEMANIFKEGYLPAKADLIKRYYLSVNQKSLSREE
jgi:hypothetical protein